MTITELKKHQLPIAGSAYHIVRNAGLAVARYLGVSGKTVNAHEMHALGLVSHLVHNEAADSLTFAVSQTWSSSSIDAQKSKYNVPVDLSLLDDIVADMDCTDPTGVSCEHRRDSGNNSSADWDIFRHPVWQHASLVPDVPLTPKDVDHFGKSGIVNEGPAKKDVDFTKLVDVYASGKGGIMQDSYQSKTKGLPLGKGHYLNAISSFEHIPQ